MYIYVILNPLFYDFREFCHLTVSNLGAKKKREILSSYMLSSEYKFVLNFQGFAGPVLFKCFNIIVCLASAVNYSKEAQKLLLLWIIPDYFPQLHK